MRRDLPAGTVTFLFTDVEGSTKLLHELGAAVYAEKLAEHRGVVRQACTAHGGVEVDTQGDAFFVAFPTATAALEAARAITEELASGRIALRIGLHTGTPLLTEEGYVGEDVHFAARVAASAHGGQVVLSEATRARIHERHPLIELGEHRLKDIPEPVVIYQLGDGQFPPLKTISNTNLPRPASSFVGRERELQEVLDRLEAGGRLVTLTGPGGSGKTRLALEAAATLVPGYKAGVFWVGLASLRDSALVTETIAQTLGAKDGLAEHVGEREMLLLLDNLEQVIEAASELSSLLQGCPNLTLLVTSRELLRVQGEIEYPVPPLAEAEGVSLFCERAQTAASAEIAELCRRLDNLPLAVELAAARTKALSPAQILDRLGQRLDLLKGGRDADPRQHTLRATIEWSYLLLKPDEQQLFARLAVFQGGCTLDAAEQVADADLDTLQSLIDKSLLRFTDSRYWMLETIREYASEQLESLQDVETIRGRQLDWLQREAYARGEPARADTEDAHAFLAAELPNARAALEWALQRGDAPTAQRLLAGYWYHWLSRGRAQEGDAWAARVVALPSEPTVLYGWALGLAGEFPRMRGAPERARGLKLRAIAVLEQLADQDADAASKLAATHSDISDVLACLGDLDGAVAHAEEGLRIRRRLGDPGGVAHGVQGLAYLAGLGRRWSDALALYEESLLLLDGSDRAGDVAYTLLRVGRARLALGDLVGARAAHEDALRLMAGSGNAYNRATAAALRGLIAREEGNVVRAAEWLAEARADAEESGFQLDEERDVERVLGECRAALGDERFEEAQAEGRRRAGRPRP